jgi:hypothetical protein
LSFDPAAALLRAVNILDIPHSKRLASGPNYGAIFGKSLFSEALGRNVAFRKIFHRENKNENQIG